MKKRERNGKHGRAFRQGRRKTWVRLERVPLLWPAARALHFLGMRKLATSLGRVALKAEVIS